MYAYLGERRVDAKFAQARVLLQPPDCLHRPERHLAHAGRATGTAVLETLGPFPGPPVQDPVDGGLVHSQVAGYGLGAPPLGVQRDHREPALRPLGHLVVGWKAAHVPHRDRLIGEHAVTVLRSGRLPKRT